jgi:predicted dienelactone hydrolase
VGVGGWGASTEARAARTATKLDRHCEPEAVAVPAPPASRAGRIPSHESDTYRHQRLADLERPWLLTRIDCSTVSLAF